MYSKRVVANTSIKFIVLVLAILLQSSCGNVMKNTTASFNHLSSSKNNDSNQKAKSGPTRKAWASNDRTIMKIGDLYISMQRRNGREYGPKEFIASTSSKNKIFANFKGSCEKIVKVNITASDMRLIDKFTFYDSPKGDNLPREVVEVINAMRTALSDQCEQLQAIRVEYNSGMFRNKSKEASYHHYKGTMLASDNWRIQDGVIATNFDNTHTVDISFRDQFSVLGVRHKGKCETNPTIKFGPLFHNKQEKTFHTPAVIDDYQRNLITFAEKYKAECPSLKVVKVTLDAPPPKYRCKTKNDCYFYVSKISENKWSVDTSRYQYFDPSDGPIKDFNDVTKFLIADDFETIKEYSNYFSLYYVSFIGAYSDYCRAKINAPVNRDYNLVEVTKIDGSVVNQNKIGDTVTVRVESAYVFKYDEYRAASKLLNTASMIMNVMKYRRQGMSPSEVAAMSLGNLVGDRRLLRRSIQGNCGSAKIQSAYKNMLKVSYKIK